MTAGFSPSVEFHEVFVVLGPFLLRIFRLQKLE